MQRKRFQRGSVYMNANRTLWLGAYTEYVLDGHGVETRVRKQVTLSPVKAGDTKLSKRDAMRILQPHLDRANGGAVRIRKTITFDAFSQIWERDYLSLSKPSTQAGMKSNLKRLKAAFGNKDMRVIDASDIQRFIASCSADGLNPKTIRIHWATISLIWQAALSQKYVDAMLPRPKLPRRLKKTARYFTLKDIARMIAASEGEHRVFCWLAAETGLRGGELAGLKLSDIDGERLNVRRSVWHCKEQTPKTNNALRTLALSPQLITLLWEQITRQRKAGSEYLFSSETGTARDMDVYRRRKLKVLLASLEIPKAGFHAFRHFNVAMMDALRVPLKTIQERIGHAVTGSFTLDVYGCKPEFERNVEAAKLAGAEIQRAVTEEVASGESNCASNASCCLTTAEGRGSGAVNLLSLS